MLYNETTAIVLSVILIFIICTIIVCCCRIWYDLLGCAESGPCACAMGACACAHDESVRARDGRACSDRLGAGGAGMISEDAEESLGAQCVCADRDAEKVSWGLGYASHMCGSDASHVGYLLKHQDEV